MSVSFKCRLCRMVILDDNDTSHIDSTFNICCVTHERLIAINESSLGTYPKWIGDCLDKGNWLKGKLYCPKCFAKLGSFNFISGSKCSCNSGPLPNIYLVRSCVDVVSQNQINTNSSLPVRQSSPSFWRTGHKKSLSWHGMKGKFSTMFDPVSNRTNLTALVEQPEPPKYHRKSGSWHYREKLGEWLDNLFISSNSRQMVVEPACGHQHCSCINAREIDPFSQVRKLHSKNAWPIEIPHKFECAVCLELLCYPRICHPCGHIFCDLCLRLIAKAYYEAHQEWRVIGDICADCPLCRSKIFWTAPDNEMENELKENYSTHYYLRCQSYEQQCRYQPLPLPGDWRRLFPLTFRHSLEPAFNAIWLSLLCLTFFFFLFVPGVYVSSSAYNVAVNYLIFDDYRDFGQLALSSGLVTGLALAALLTAMIFIIFIG